MITTINEFLKLNESIIKRSKDQDVFNYKTQINNMWRPVITKAQKFQHINFDLENNDTLCEKKTVIITKNLRKDQPVKYEFNIELCEAGGDWEMPVMYFKIEFTHDYNIVSFGRKLAEPVYVWDLKTDDVSGLTNHYVIIPGIEQGNHLVKTENGYTAFDDNDKANSITDKDKKTAWKWIEELLTKLVDERHEMIDDDRNTEISEPSDI